MDKIYTQKGKRDRELQWIIPRTEMYNMYDREKKTKYLKVEFTLMKKKKIFLTYHYYGCNYQLFSSSINFIFFT